MTILVTGAAGFIGHALTARLLARGEEIVGIDNLNDYYTVQLKRDRLTNLAPNYPGSFAFHEVDFADSAALETALRALPLRSSRSHGRPARRTLLADPS